MRALASIVISTKDRRDELCPAIRSALAQSVPVEVLVIDDGSTDGTEQMVRNQFPSVRLERSESSLGYIAQRNRGAQLATTDVIFSIDDDAIFASPHTVAQTLAEFGHPRVGAVAIPYLEPNKSPALHQRAPSRDHIFVADTFIGTAHAIRRDVFVRMGGYRELLIHQGEEADFCIRMLEHGYVVRLGTADPIHHLESPRRDFARMDFYGRRNDVLFAWNNVPMPFLLFHLPATTLNGIWCGFRYKRPLRMLRGTINGLGSCILRFRRRRPVAPKTYRLGRRLKKRGPLALEDLELALPSVSGI